MINVVNIVVNTILYQSMDTGAILTSGIINLLPPKWDLFHSSVACSLKNLCLRSLGAIVNSHILSPPTLIF